MIGVEAELHQRIAHGDAVTVACVEHALVEGAGHRAAAEQRRGEAHPLLVGKADDFDRERQALAAAVEIGDAGDRRDHAQRPVPFAGVAHGVVVRAEHQARQARPLAFVAAADIADRVEMRTHAGVAHPAQDEFGGGAQLAGQIDAGELVGFFGDRRELVDPADDLFAERSILNGVASSHLGELSISWDRGDGDPGGNRYKFGASEISCRRRSNQRVVSMNARRRQTARPSSCTCQAG